LEIRIDNINEKGKKLEFEKTYDFFPVISEMVEKNELKIFSPIIINLLIKPQLDMFKLSGWLKTRAQFICNRCLKNFELDLNHDFELMYSTKIPETKEFSNEENEIEINADEVGLVIFSGSRINFKDSIEEQIILSLPSWPICNELCKGLCSQCGADLNIEKCSCKKTNFENKFDALKNIKFD